MSSISGTSWDKVRLHFHGTSGLVKILNWYVVTLYFLPTSHKFMTVSTHFNVNKLIWNKCSCKLSSNSNLHHWNKLAPNDPGNGCA